MLQSQVSQTSVGFAQIQVTGQISARPNQFALLSLESRIKAVKENHACFRCFKDKVTPKSVFFLSSPIKVYTELSYSPNFQLLNCMLFREISLQKSPKFDIGRCHFETNAQWPGRARRLSVTSNRLTALFVVLLLLLLLLYYYYSAFSWSGSCSVSFLH